MSLLYALLILALLALPLGIAIRRSTELFVVTVTRGNTRLVRGRLPPRLFNDLCDVLGHPPAASARVNVIAQAGHPRVVVSRGSLPAGQLQRLQNLVGSYQTQQIRSGKRRP
ncbi:MAG TPA: DUF3634 family protein [Polyangiaceae bacterium]|jgi:hypothetical protein